MFNKWILTVSRLTLSEAEYKQHVHLPRFRRVDSISERVQYNLFLLLNKIKWRTVGPIW